MKPGTELAADYALLKSMEWADIIRAVVVDKDDEYLHAVRRVLDDQAQRIRELEGAAITDAAVDAGMSFDWYKPGTVTVAGTRQTMREFIGSILAALRSESHQASADDPSAPSGVDEAVGEHLVPEMTEGEGLRRMKAQHYNVHDPQPGEGKDG